MNRERGKFHFEHWHKVALLLMIYDLVAVNLAYFLALLFRFDVQLSTIPDKYWYAFTYFIPLNTVFSAAVFVLFRQYKSVWRFASYTEFWRTLYATLATSMFHIIGISLLYQRMPWSYHLFGALMQFAFMLGIRFSYRFVLLERSKREKNNSQNVIYRAMLIGAGSAGSMILRDLMRASESNIKVCCIIDDNPNKWNRTINGVPIVGGREDILFNVEKYKIDKIFIAIPSATAEEKRDIVGICNETSCELKILPGMYQFVTGEIAFDKMQNVSVEDLLGREQIQVNLSEICSYITGKTILVTGGGGSIGSELCRQIADNNPKRLIIFDIYENNAYDIEQELKIKYPKLDLVVLIGSVRDARRINSVFAEYKPDIVYHAAAHKHVPLMETSPCEAIKNNVLGTYNTAYTAIMNGTKKFVLISTDKAVNPTNIMGASKRICEMIVQSLDKIVKSGEIDKLPNFAGFDQNSTPLSLVTKEQAQAPVTEFVAVRFGNVLGSICSVIPLFKKQIERGGPVTVTHPDIIRYFMTIPEAVSLVLQAGTYAKGGEIFVLDMGEPVKIDTLARNLIKLSGFQPDVDIPVVYSGLRPGEKLYEEKLMDEEGLKTTPNKLIHIGLPIDIDIDTLFSQLVELTHISYNNSEEIREIVKDMVPTYLKEEQEEQIEQVEQTEKRVMAM